MALSVFPFEPSYSTSAEFEFKQQEVQFGDGYVQRAADGINNRKLILTVVFNKRTAAEISAIKAFLTALDGQPFEWTPPPPDDWSNAATFVPGASYTVGQKVKFSSYYIYVCIVANTDSDLTDATHWVYIGKIPMQFVCKKGQWAADSYNSNSLTATFEQDFTPGL
jgi:phage-related protein